VDLPGAGGSDDPPEDYGIEGFADALAGFVSALGLEHPHLVGLSFGGMIAIELCRRHPDVPTTVTLVGAYAGWRGSLSAHEADRRLDQAMELSRLAPHELVEALLPTMFAPSADPGVVAAYGEALARFHPSGFRAMAHACNVDLRDALSAVKVPTLLIYGGADSRASSEVSSPIHEAISGSELVVLGGAGHLCNVDAADSFNTALRRFVRQHTPG
jgi:pimeloyl-ACP methyl ester carboxylesterase